MYKVLISLCLIMLLLSACAPGMNDHSPERPAGFFWGIWHGWIAPLSLIFGFFNDTTRIYELNNSGLWYDLGFYIAIISGFGGFSLSRKKKKD